MNPLVTRRSDAFRLIRGQGSLIIAEFGLRGIPAQSGAPVPITVTDRIGLSLEAVRRLLVQLDEALMPHLAALRSEEVKRLPPEAAAAALLAARVPVRPLETVQADDGLLELVRGLGGAPLYERSFRVSQGTLRADRFIVSFDVYELGSAPLQQVLEVCGACFMPASARGAAEAAFANAGSIHFGSEGSGNRRIYKLYFEHRIASDQLRAGQRELLHTAFKWNAESAFCITSRYFWYPDLGIEDIRKRLTALYDGLDPAALGYACQMLDIAAARLPGQHLQYLEVEEAGTARRSFDLNLYDAGLRLKDILPVLHGMRAHFGIRSGEFQALVDDIRSLLLGHLAGGVHRDGGGFFNVYYGMQPLSAKGPA